MCSYETTQVALQGSAKRESGWTGIAGANIYHACPYPSALDDALNIDFIVKDDSKGQQRIALELSVESAVALAHSILATLEAEGHVHG
jgi:hypothetical protein